MHGWWMLMGAVITAGTAIAPRLHRRHRRRVQVARARAALATWLPALKQPDDTTVLDPPTEDNLSPSASPRQAAPTGCVVRPQHRVAPSDPSLSAALSPGWRLK